MTEPIELELPDALANAEDLPSVPAVVVEVLRLTRDEDSTIGDFGGVISKDPALAAKLLKHANSPTFGVGEQVKTLERACMVLGLKSVQLMALGFSLQSSLHGAGEQGGCSLEESWARSLTTAVAARAFSRHLGRRLDDESFLCGLLSQIGHLTMLQCMPDAYAGVLERAGGRWPTRELEIEVLGLDRAVVAAGLLKKRGLPEPIYRAIGCASRFPDVPAEYGTEVRDLAEALSLADLAARVVRDQAKGEPLHALRTAASEAGIGEEDLGALFQALEPEIREMARLLDVELAPGLTHAEILAQAHRQVTRISLGAAADLHRAERRAEDLANENRELSEKASKDELTGILNRAGFDAVLGAELRARRAQRASCVLGLLMIDADHFKQFNDTHGHPAGDAVLRTIGRILGQTLRESDCAARYGGEEFVVIAPTITPEGLRVLAERLRQAIEAEVTEVPGARLQVTVSVGGAFLAEPGDEGTAASLIEAADQRLYEAKRHGRNRCVVAEHPVGRDA